MSSKIPVENIYYLLCYAWGRLDEGELTMVDSESCDTLQDLFAKVLISGTQRLVKQGFHRGYIEEVEETSSLRGRIAFSPSVRAMSWSKGRMVCEYTELSYDTIPNRILKTTLRNLLYTEGVGWTHKDQIAGLLHKLHEVSPIRITSKLFRRIQYHQNLRFYRFLMNVCEFVHESLLLKEGSGESHFQDFIRDDRKMAYVFEDFIRNFYERERPDYHVGRQRFKWQGLEGDDAAKFAAARSLHPLVQRNAANRVLFAEAGGIPPLLELLRDGSAGAKAMVRLGCVTVLTDRSSPAGAAPR